jgi:mycothiol synthase
MAATVAEELLIRRPTIDDAGAVHALMVAYDTEISGEEEISLIELVTDWQQESFDLSRDAWMVTNQDGEVIGYGDLFHRGYVRFDGTVYVHAGHRNRGIGTSLIRLIEERAREQLPHAPAGVPVVLNHGFVTTDEPMRERLAREGYSPSRYFWRMLIEMEGAPPAPSWPAGIVVKPFVPEQDDHATFEAMEEAFADHWGHVDTTLEEWSQRHMSRADYDPSLWFLAMDGNEIAAAAICYDEGDSGWVQAIGVRPAWRRRGLALAMLYHIFAGFQRRGKTRVALAVDAENPTGATRLYEKVGMRVTRQYVVYHKELRPARPA